MLTNSGQGMPDRIAKDLALVEELIRKRSGSGMVDRINRIVTHILDGGGKRIRPILTLSTANLFGCEGHHHIDLAAAVEFVHTATLVHDDVVDESMQRRGRATVNTLWDNKSAVLVGDYLFARSFQLMVSTRSIEALSILADASATIAEAEVLQLVTQHDLHMGNETYFRIISGKTAALFSAAARVGAVVADATPGQIGACERYGHALGTGFQIMDDVLDYAGTASDLGKNVGDDFRDRKVTLPVIRAMQTADDKERSFWHRTIVAGDQEDGDTERAVEVLTSRGILESVSAEARDWSNRARRNLDSFPPGQFLDYLGYLADFSVKRSG